MTENDDNYWKWPVLKWKTEEYIYYGLYNENMKSRNVMKRVIGKIKMMIESYKINKCQGLSLLQKHKDFKSNQKL